MRVVVTGASGFLGSALVPALRGAGHDVVRLVRRPTTAPDEVRWDPAAGSLDSAALGVVDAAVNLSGAGVGDKRWTPEYQQVIRKSRVDSTRTLTEALAQQASPPRVLLSGSAIGFYGDTGDLPADETSPSGDTFLAGVVRDWEAAASPAERAGIRTVFLRTGLVLDSSGGALQKMWPLLKLGLGGPLGSGRQIWSWITRDDIIATWLFLLTDPAATTVSGPVNLTAPTPVSNREVLRSIAHEMHRPALFPAPAAALKLAIGGFAEEILCSQYVLPARLTELDYPFQHPDIATAARSIVG